MPDAIQVVMASTAPTADVPTGSKAELDLPASAATPDSWKVNGKDKKPLPTLPVQVPPTPGQDDLYEMTDTAGTTLSAVVRWQPGAPPTVSLKPGKGNASITWTAIGDEAYIDYYEVGLDPAPPQAQVPRKVKQAAGTRGSNRALSVDGLPPGFYTAQVRAIRESSYGAGTGAGIVASAEVTTEKPGKEVLPTGGTYPTWVRILLGSPGLAALGGAIYLLVTNPRVTHTHSPTTIGLNGWALGISALVTFALIMGLCTIVRVGDLLSGADNRISTSRVNVALWTVAIAFGIITLAAFAFGAQHYHLANPCGLTAQAGQTPPADINVDGICVNGHAIDVSKLGLDTTFKNGLAPNYLVLLGAPFAALASSAFIVGRQVGNGDRQKVQSSGPSNFTDALTNDDGSADLVDSQYLIFTGVMLFYFVTNFLPNPSVLPDLPWSLVGLTGVSAGTYLLNKAVTANGLSVQGLAAPSVKQGDTARVVGLNFLPDGSAGLPNGGVSIALDDYTPTITEVSNTDVTFSTQGIPTGTYNVRLTTAANVSASAGSLIVT